MEADLKLSILFVDDEPALLQVLPAALEATGEPWEASFAVSGAHALEIMAQSRFDVVVSDLSMPKMDGLTLLKEVRERFPLTARIIYSGQSDQRSILACAGVIHQFLPKPCPVEVLKATIRRAAMVRALVPSPSIRELVSKLEKIPSVPSLYLELVKILESETASSEDVARTVAKDMGMTAQILKIANSAYFGLSQQVSNVQEAIGFVGTELVKDLALAVGVFSQYEAKSGGLSIEALWQHSMQTAAAARKIARSERASRQIIEDSFTAGLLHDIGKLVLAGSFPDRYQEMTTEAKKLGVETLVQEREVFGVDHAEVGGYLLGLWGLPAGVVESVAFHHFPTKSERVTFGALAAVHMANVIVQSKREKQNNGAIVPEIDLLYLARIGKLDTLDHWRDELAAQPT